ncbi:MAG: acyl-CoA dehydrogenase family protein [Actinomycetota bacterium]
MRVAYNDEQIALRDELRAYFARVLTPEVRKELGPRAGEHQGPEFRRVVGQFGKDGWLGVGWPKEYGGQGRSAIEQYIFYDEARKADAPIPLVTLNTVGPTLMQHGSAEQKARFLPAILAGEIFFAIGYTEPGAGTDLASLRTRAARDGDSYIVNGQKIFTTGAHDADFIWLAARTDPDVPKHKGLSILIVEATAPGVKTTPINTLDDGRTNAVYFEDVKVPATAIVGEENEGWRLITTQLNHERLALACSGVAEQMLDDTVAWAQQTRAPGGERIIDRSWVQLTLARARARLDALRLLNWRLAWELTKGILNPADASAVKVYGTELFVEVYRAIMEVLGEAGTLKAGSPGAVLGNRVELMYRWAYVVTFGGGVNEVQREIIATAGLGMPRTGR